jgi:hypothetical protein
MTRTALLTNEAFGHTELSDDVGIFSDEASLIHGLDTMLSSRSTWEGAGRRLYDAIVRAHLPQHRAQQLTRFIERNS